MSLKNKEILFLTFLFLVTAFLRFPQLGFSNYYGDETKVLYLRKDVAADDFLLNQRKGPVQFVAAWAMETITGGYDEMTTRLPFAVAGVLAVFAFYLLVKKLYNFGVAVFASLIFSLCGFFVAFSRTVQYQSFLLLFGILAVLFAVHYFQSIDSRRRKIYLFLSGVFLALAYLAHWDALFFDIAIAIILIKEISRNRSAIKEIFIYLLIPFFVVLGAFLLPYYMGGYFSEHVTGYMSRRFTGSNQLPNNSFYTTLIYNPSFAYFVPFLFIPFAFLGFKGFKNDFKLLFLTLWFSIPFFVMEILIANPGTHIYNYMIPLIIMASVGIYKVYVCLWGWFRLAFKTILAVVFFLMFVTAASVYIPFLNTGYPWTGTKIGPFNVSAIEKDKYQLFLYGFPYNSGWDQIRDYVEEKGGIRNYYTNDNVTIAEYYLEGIDVHKPHPNQMPQYYFVVFNNQEFTGIEEGLLGEYVLEKEFKVDGSLVSEMYRKK